MNMTNGNEFVKLALRIDGLSLRKEIVFCEPVENGTFIIRNIPAFVYGVGYGDEIQLQSEESGDFSVIRRGGNVAIRVFIDGSLERTEVDHIIQAVTHAKGLHEIARNARNENDSSLLLLSFPIAFGFSEIEKLMTTLQSLNAKWEYANVYNESGEPLNWWLVKNENSASSK
jgi:hypothetical protein